MASSDSYLPITGTFIDEITVDIPAQNWGPAEWATEFDTFVTAGIDTVIMIRAGCGERLACPSRVIADREIWVDATAPTHSDEGRPVSPAHVT